MMILEDQNPKIENKRVEDIPTFLLLQRFGIDISSSENMRTVFMTKIEIIYDLSIIYGK